MPLEARHTSPPEDYLGIVIGTAPARAAAAAATRSAAASPTAAAAPGDPAVIATAPTTLRTTARGFLVHNFAEFNFRHEISPLNERALTGPVFAHRAQSSDASNLFLKG